VDNGAAAQAAIVTLFTNERGLIADFQAKIKALPTTDPNAFAKVLYAFANALQSAATEVGSSLSQHSPELDAAVNAEPACAATNTSG
jgi:predicted ATPase